MRLTDYYNIFASFLFVALVIWYCYSVDRKSYVIGSNIFRTSETFSLYQAVPLSQRRFLGLTIYDYAALLMLVIGCVLRLYKLSTYPFGFNQDEASIGYDGWSILTYGIDRNGFHNPVYPITWGSGGGSPLMVYLVGLSQKILGSSVLSVRLPIAITGCLTIILFTAFVRLYYGDKAGFAAAFVIALNPWQLMQSRWTLDCNMTPFFILISILLFLIGISRQRTVWYVLSAASFALCLYTYGSTTIVIPIYLLIICTIAMRRGLLTVRQFVLGIITFLFVVLPLAVFYAVNYLNLPEIITPWFSVNKFVSKRSIFMPLNASLPLNILKNLMYVVNVCTFGYMAPYNELDQTYLPAYVTMYRFTFPVTILGFIVCVRRSLQSRQRGETIIPEEMFLLHFIVSAAFSLFIEPGISRSTLLFLNVIFFQVIALESIGGHTLLPAEPDSQSSKSKFVNWRNQLMRSVPINALLLLIWTGSAVLFVRDYFGHEARTFQTYGFMPLYGQAVEYAESVREEDQNIVSTKHSLVDPYMLALFFSHTSPYDYLETSEYIRQDNEFRETNHFTHYDFVLPSFESADIKAKARPEDILIVHFEETGHFSEAEYDYHQFGDYYVLVPRR